MAKVLMQCKGPLVVGVVGLGHLDGIEKNWNKYQKQELERQRQEQQHIQQSLSS